ncbi:MAG: flap endonuclease-1 [Candidatus Hodarchaeales archaeon]|jgi:flap endonuclease-1
MGFKISDLIKEITRTVTPKDLTGKKLGIDAFNVIYQFLARIRDVDTGGMQFTDKEGRVTSHLIGMFSRTSFMLLNNMKPLYVFDGQPPEFKKEEIVKRREVKVEAAAKQAEALKAGDMAAAAKYAQATSKITPQIIEDAQRLLDLMGVPYRTASSEAEAEISMLVQQRAIYATCSQDYDALLFGSPRVIRNLSVSQRRKISGTTRFVAQPITLVETERALSHLEIDRKQLILMALMVGTDFGPGVKGIGPKTALKIVMKHPDLESLLDHLKRQYLDTEEKYRQAFPHDPAKIFDFFMNPPFSDQVNIKWGKLDVNGLVNFLCKERDFSEDRVLPNSRKIQKMQQQTSLMSFF